MAKKDTKKAKPAPKKAVKPAKKAAKPAPKKAAKPAPKKAVKPAAKKIAKPAPKKVSKPVAKKVVKPVAKAKPAPKKADKKTTKPAAKPAKALVKKTEKKAAMPAKKDPKPAATPAKKEMKAAAKPAAKDLKKPVGKPIDAIKKSGKPSPKAKKGRKDEDDEEDDVEVEEEEDDDSDVEVKDDYEKAEEEDDAVVDLDEPPLLDVEGAAPIDDDDDDEIPEKRGRGRRKKATGRSSESESYIRNRPLQIDITKPLIKKPAGDQPKPFVNTKDNRSRYTDKELTEFKALILEKLKEAQTDYDLLKQTLSNADNHGTDDTSPTFKLLEDGSDVLSKEETAQLASRQEKYIINLKNALVRIENKTYGICRVTGKLIPKERLRSVPHATLGIDAKLNQSS